MGLGLKTNKGINNIEIRLSLPSMNRSFMYYNESDFYRLNKFGIVYEYLYHYFLLTE